GKNVFGRRTRTCPKWDFTKDTITSPGGGTERGYFFCDPSLELIGGDRYLLTQFEYDLTSSGPFVFGVFLDMGEVLAEDDNWGLYYPRMSTGLETRIYLPVFGAPLRFIWGVPIREEKYDRTTSFQFSIGSSF